MSVLSVVLLLFVFAFLGEIESRPSRVERDAWSPTKRTSEGPGFFCSHMPWLKPHQKKKCLQYPQTMITSIHRGVEMALSECQNHFSDHRWNCSGLNSAQLFREMGILKTDTRESAYVYAITSAGVSYQITKDCTIGKWTKHCGCDTRVRGRVHKDGEASWEWGGCSENVRYGDEVSRKFMDPDPIRKDIRYLLTTHNNDAGRKALKENMGKNCKCHGVSGSCTVKICWRTMPNFNIVAELLRKKFDRSNRVKANTNKTKLLKTSRGKRGKRRKRKSRRPSPTDLVYTKDSPDFCHADPDQGILGTRGRLCNKTSSNNDGCKNMCCGNGYNTIERSSKVKCNCEFIWCCKVQCELCEKDWFEYRCK